MALCVCTFPFHVLVASSETIRDINSEEVLPV
jgi:hypothetical protein